MQLFTLAKRGRVALFAVVCAGYLYGLGAMPLVGPDEPRYAQVAREMFARGDWVTPWLAGHTWFEKPALLYWMMMAAFSVFGVTEAAARLGAAVSGLSTVLIVWWLAARAEREAGFAARGLGAVAAAVAASSAGLLVFSRGASFDAPLTLTVTAALACFFLAEGEQRDARRRRWLLVACYASAGAALLAKGLAGAVIITGVAAAYLLVRRRPFEIFRLGALWGPLVALAVAALWYAPVIARHGHAFVDEFFLQHHLARFTSNRYHHPQPFYFYVPVMALLALPWTAFLLSALADLLKMNWRAQDSLTRMRLLGLVWLAVPVAFFSLSGSKLPGYVLPALPGAALLAGERVFRYLNHQGGTWPMRLTGALALLLFAAGAVFAGGALDIKGAGGGDLPSAACVVAVVLPAGVAGALAVFAARRRALAFWSVTGATFLTLLLIAACALEPIAHRQTVKPLLHRATAAGFGALPVFQLHTVERTSEFYAAGRLVYDPAGDPFKFEGVPQLAAVLAQRGGAGLVLVPTDLAHQLADAPTLEARSLGDNGELALFYVSNRQ